MAGYHISYDPPKGRPLGVNPTFRFGASVVIPILRAITKRDWQGAQFIPKSGPVIVCSNHLSYLDVLMLTHFLYKNGRADVLKGFLEKKQIYLTKEFSCFEEKARKNIENEINLLTSSKKIKAV
jgi:1-acyl-sn-glycerol-3-phosphate acyltransferase